MENGKMEKLFEKYCRKARKPRPVMSSAVRVPEEMTVLIQKGLPAAVRREALFIFRRNYSSLI